MKNLLFIPTLLLGHVVIGQFRIDPIIKNEFDSVFSLTQKEIQEKRHIEGFDDGLAMILVFKVDTLNIKSYTPHIIDTSIKIVSIDPNTGDELPDPPKDTSNYNQWLPSQATLLKDTLHIGSYFGLFSRFGFSVKIIGKKSIGNYFEYESGNSIYRYKLTKHRSSDIQVKAQTENVVLSDIPRKLGDVFYGKVTLVTEPFYEDDDDFETGYIHKSYTITYLFTCKVSDGGEK